ncbi:MAG: hypothetical protein LBC75_13325 [Fibromonadaceae bacterium]|jgi:hypothetical protein|nr:hypothetical protein [Fibromonadaceae bacterium]
MKKILILCLLAFGFASSARQSFVVLPCIGSFDVNGLERLRDKMEEVTRNTLPQADYRLIPYKDVREEVGDEALFEACEEGGLCFGKLAGQANADYGSWCMVNKYDGKWLLKYQLYSVAEKDILFTKEYDSYNPKNLNDLVDIIKREVPSVLSEKLLGIKTEIKEPVKTSRWVAIGLDVLGVALLGYAVYEDGNVKDAFDRYSERGHTEAGYYEGTWEEAESSRTKRNAFYVIGGAVLASGIGLHIWF